MDLPAQVPGIAVYSFAKTRACDQALRGSNPADLRQIAVTQAYWLCAGKTQDIHEYMRLQASFVKKKFVVPVFSSSDISVNEKACVSTATLYLIICDRGGILQNVL